MKTRYKILMGLKIAAGITLFVLLFGYGTMLLWNVLVPELFGGPVISFGQALGLLVLSKILFGGFGRGGWGRRGHCGERRYGWRSRWQEKMSNMTPEEKEAFKAKLKEKCSGYWS